MKILKIRYENDLIILGSPAHSNSYSVAILLEYLYQYWKSNKFNTDLVKQSPLIDKILNFLPRLDLPKTDRGKFIYGIDSFILEQFSNDFIESLFLKISNKETNTFDDGEISKLLEIDTSYHKKRVIKSDLPEPPNPTSGDDNCDLMVILTLYLNNSFSDAVSLIENYDSQFIYDFIYQFGEMNRDPKERELEYRAEIFDEWKQKNQSTYKSYLGI